MLEDVCQELAKIGLNLNADECSTQCSKTGSRKAVAIKVQGQNFLVVSRDKGFKILGTLFTLNGSTTAEFDQRLRAAYGKLHELWPLLGKEDACSRRR